MLFVWAPEIKDFFFHDLLFRRDENTSTKVMLAESGLLSSCSPAGQHMCGYGDPAHLFWIHLQTPYREERLSQQMEDCNKATK